jgi:urease accessory protein
LNLLHLCDSLFPTGGFAHSDGLEAATSAGDVRTSGDLALWMETVLDETIARQDGPSMLAARAAALARHETDIVRIDREALALKPASTLRRASRAMGSRLIETWRTTHPSARLEMVSGLIAIRQVAPSLPVAFGCVCAAGDIGPVEAVEAFAYTRLAAIASAAMRLMPIGQTEAHRLLARVLERIPAMASDLAAGPREAQSFAPRMDIAAMSQQYLHSRLFLS